MDKKRDLVKKLKKFKRNLSNEISVEKMIFFGSRASNRSHKNSDIDLIIVSNRFRKLKFRERSLGFYKYWDLNYPVDFLCYTPEEFKKMSKMITIVREAVKKGIEL